MPNSMYINEVRINVPLIGDQAILRFRSSGLSTGHKKRIEHELQTQHQCVAFFEGDVLFGIFVDEVDIEAQRTLMLQFLSTHLRAPNQSRVENTTLAQMPIASVERFIFTALCYQAGAKGIFSIYGHTFFIPTSDAAKRSHTSVEVTLVTEDDSIKIYFVPSYTALVSIENTYRTERHDLEVVNLCKHRGSCSLAAKNGSCPYVYPGRLGYYEREVLLSSLPKDRQDAFHKAYEKCPKLPEATKVVLAKASKAANRNLAYPLYVVHARLSRPDLQNDTRVAQQYRQATLMNSGDRWRHTSKWLTRLFGQEGRFEIGHLQIPIETLLSIPHPIGGRSTTSYRTIRIAEQAVTIDQQNPQPRRQSGGWLFTKNGAFDREDVNRPFTHVHPYLVVPKDSQIQVLTRRLLEILSDGEYQPRLLGDQPFLGLNRAENQNKYNCKFINVWDEEEPFYSVDGTDADYLRKAQDIVREWNRSATGDQDPNRIVLVVVPSAPEDDDEVTVYHKMKKVFLEEGIPSQFLTVDTLTGLDNKSVAFGPVLQSLWQNIYTKLGGKPWRLANQLENVHCFIGIGFGLNPRSVGKHIYAGVANVFDKYGSWVDIASDSRSLSEVEREDFERTQKYLEGTSSFEISQNLTQSIVYDALRLYEQYQTTTKQPPRNIILHKLGRIYECELVGLLEAIKQTLGTLDDCKLGILQIEQDHQIRLYGDSHEGKPKVDRTVYRGDGLVINNRKIVLTTTGQVYRGSDSYYPGIGTPVPLLLTSQIPSTEMLRQYGCHSSQFYTIDQMAKHAMALTQLHWGSTRDLIRLPITTLYAQKVADLVSKTQANINSWMKYHRPWFL